MKVFGLLLLLCGTVAVPGRAARSQSDKYGHNVIDNNWDTEIDHHELETLSCVRLSIFNLEITIIKNHLYKSAAFPRMLCGLRGIQP